MKVLLLAVAGYYLLGRLGYRVRLERTYTEKPLLGVVRPPGLSAEQWTQLRADARTAANSLRESFANQPGSKP